MNDGFKWASFKSSFVVFSLFLAVGSEYLLQHPDVLE